MEPSAKIILDSIAPSGVRLTTMEVTFHRFVLAEFNTHRLFSRNSASSRAIPVWKQIDKVLEEPALPLHYRYNQAGMQAAGPMSPIDAAMAQQIILDMRNAVADGVGKLASLGPVNEDTGKPVGLHKQWANRYLEPWMWHTVIVTATSWEGFWDQRVSPLAQPEIEAPAELMLAAYENSVPTRLDHGEWHTPYIRPEEYEEFTLEDRKKISAARCARVSYLTHDGKRDIQADLDMYAGLISANPPHWSPLEHVATPLASGLSSGGNFIVWNNIGARWYPDGWAQLRHNP